MDFKRLTDAIFERLQPYQLARHYKYAELIYTDGEDLPASWCDGELRHVVDDREWNEGIMYIRQNGTQTIREDEASAFVGCQVMQVGTIPLRLVLIARRSDRFTPFDVAQTISSAVSGMYSNLALQIGAQYVNVINTVTESNARVVLEDEFKQLERVSFDSHLYAVWVDIEVEVKGDAACMASDACDPIIPDPILNKVATPQFEPTGGVFGGFGEFTLSCETAGASIYYTLDGSPVTPQTGLLYDGTPVLVVSSTVPKAKAFLNGWVDSDTATAQFQVELLALSFNIEGGTFPIDSPPTIVPIINNVDADVYYTTDGSTPTELSTPFTTPFIPTQNTTLTGRGFLDPALPSNVVQEMYGLKLNTPVLDTTSGTYISQRLVSSAPAAVGVNEYRVDSGSWVVGDSVLVDVSSVVTFRATDPNYVTSDEVSVAITIQCADVTFSPAAGAINTATPIALSTATAGATIRYTTDGSEPNQTSTIYTGTFTLPSNATVRARAFKSGCVASNITSAAYTVVDVNAAAYLSAAGITDTTKINAINTFFVGLKSDGVYSKLRAMWLFFPTGTADGDKLNIIDPRDLDAAYRLQFIGGITHSTSGITPNGTTGYARTFFDVIQYNSLGGLSFGAVPSTRPTTLGGSYIGTTYNNDTPNFLLWNYVSGLRRDSIWLASSAEFQQNDNGTANLLFASRTAGQNTFTRIVTAFGTATTTSNTEVPVTTGSELFLFARRRVSTGLPDAFSNATMQMIFIGAPMNGTELTLLRNRYVTLRAAF